MYFGYTNTPMDSMDFINRDFKKYLDIFVIVLIDDILICLRIEDVHVKNLRILLQILKDRELYSNLNMCEFWLRFVSFLGHIVSRKGV